MVESRREFLKKTGAAVTTSMSSSFGASTGSFSRAAPTSQQQATEDSAIKDISWEMGPPMPWPTKGQAQAAIGDAILAAGSPGYPGWVPKAPLGRLNQLRDRGNHNSAWRLDTRTMKYEILPELPVGIKWPRGVAVGEDFYVLTGWVIWPKDQNDPSSNRMFRLSKRSGTWRWKELPGLDIGRFSPGRGATVVGSTIVVLGGQASFGQPRRPPFSGDHPGVYVNAVEAFDTSSPESGWTHLPPFPSMARTSMATTAIGQNIYIFGGIYINYAEHDSGPLGPHIRGCGDAYVFNLETQQWRRLPDVPRPVYGWDAAPYKDRYIIITGGIKDYPVEHPYQHKDRISEIRSPNFDVLVFDTLRETYRVLPSQILPYQAPAERRQQLLENKGFDFSKGVYRLSAELSRVGNKLYLCGGEVVSPHNVTDEVVIGTILEE